MLIEDKKAALALDDFQSSKDKERKTALQLERTPRRWQCLERTQESIVSLSRRKTHKKKKEKKTKGQRRIKFSRQANFSLELRSNWSYRSRPLLYIRDPWKSRKRSDLLRDPPSPSSHTPRSVCFAYISTPEGPELWISGGASISIHSETSRSCWNKWPINLETTKCACRHLTVD